MNTRSLLAGSLGNILEWFDFGLFIYFAPIIGQKFFPIRDPHSATIAAFSVFAAGFICRPLGGMFFGYWGDKKGRAATLRWSIFAITCATLLVGFLPTYQQVGIFALILFALLRLIQGLSVGGEYSGIAVYLAESAPNKNRGFFTSFAASSANLGFLLATFTAILLKSMISATTIDAWAWRLPFIFAGIIGLFIFYYRLKLLETPEFLQLQARHQIQKNPLLTAFRYAPKKLLRIVGLTCMGSTFYFVFFGYVPTYLSQHDNIKLLNALGFQAILLIVMMLLIPIAGFCGDRFGRKKMLLVTAISIILLVIPCFYLLQFKTVTPIFIALSIATLFSSLEQGNTLVTAAEHCPLNIRYSGVSFSYNLGNALFGGTAPLIAATLMQNVGYFFPAYYLMGMAIISLIAIVTLTKSNEISLSY